MHRRTCQSPMHRRSSRFALLLFFVLIVLFLQQTCLAKPLVASTETFTTDPDRNIGPHDPEEERGPNDGSGEKGDNQHAVLQELTREDEGQKVAILCYRVEGFQAARAARFHGLGEGHFDPRSAPQ